MRLGVLADDLTGDFTAVQFSDWGLRVSVLTGADGSADDAGAISIIKAPSAYAGW